MKVRAVASHLQGGKKRQLLVPQELDAPAGPLFDAL
jgi:hypothetical protein